MPFKLFALQAFGRLKPTEKIESERNALYADYLDYLKVDNSKELEKYLELEAWTNSEDLKKFRVELKNLQFKGSHEHKDLIEYQKLDKSKKIVSYLQTNESTDLKRFFEIDKSDILKDYFKLKDFVEGGEFRAEKKDIESKTFKGSPEESHLKEYNSLKKTKGIKAYFKLHNSAELKGHNDFADSKELAAYLDLKNTPDKDKAGKKKFAELSRGTQLRKYFKFENSNLLKLYRETLGSHQLKRFF